MSLLPQRLANPAALLLTLVLVVPARGSAQPSTRFTVGGRDIVRMDFASTPLGDFPSALEMVDGIMEVVSKNGQNMLRASSRSVFRVQLPQLLPQDFTLEFDIIPKAGGNPEDLAIEGTPLINQGGNSANVQWHREHLRIHGGGASYDSKVPPSFAATLPGVLTQVVVSMQGETMKLYTNGRLMFTQSNRKFVRGRVLRVFLGGQDDGPNAVYLASFRVVANGPPVGPVAATNAPSSNPNTPAPLTPVLVQPATTATGMTVTAPPGTNPAASPAPAASTQPPLRTAPAPYAAGITSMLGPPMPRTISLSDVTAAGPSNTVSPRSIALTGISATGSLVAIVAIVPRTVALPEILAIGGLRTVRTAIAGVSSPAPAPRNITLGAVVASGGFATVPSVPSRTIALTAIAASGGFAMPRPRTITLTTITATGSRIP
jgi:hypothetical protein